MKCRALGITLVVTGLVVGLTPRTAQAAGDDDKKPLSVTVSFGRGLNTATQGNTQNHHVLPQRIRVRVGGVVNFAVAGFHQIYVYLPGKMPSQVIIPPGEPPFINDEVNLYYKGIQPAGGPLATAPTGNPSNASNRVEPVAFLAPGTYLVICNVRGHFLDGMFAWVKVSDDDDDDDDDDHHGRDKE